MNHIHLVNVNEGQLRRRLPDFAEAARRAAYDVQLAREVQARLVPRKLPPLESLSYAGVSIPAGQVGGDYFDFLGLGRGYLGVAVGDVAGKGFAAALLVAGLQASLRSQCALAVDDLGSLLRSVNRMLCESMREESYATLFFAEYSDASRRLRYVNCGHPAALLLHPDGTLGRLEPTATVLGLAEEWDCALGEASLVPGDMLLVYTDGVIEARNQSGEEFGADRLAEVLRVHGQRPVSELLRRIVAGVECYAGGRLEDDLTLVAARCEGAQPLPAAPPDSTE